MVKAQGTTFNSAYFDSSQVQVCDTTYTLGVFASYIGGSSTNSGNANLVFTGANYNNATITATVQWGDNTTTTHTGVCSGDGIAINWITPLIHSYPQDGMYYINVVLYDSISGDSITSGIDVTFGNCPVYIYTITELDCDGDGIIDNDGLIPPIILTNGINIFQSNSNVFYNVDPGNYAITIDPNWLAANNYLIQSMVFDSISVGSSNSNTITNSILLTCDSTLFSPQCLTGVVFCDANNNGIFDSTETVLSNAPVYHYPISNVNSNGYQDTTNTNGEYSFNYYGSTSNFSELFVDQNWITSNGYFASPYASGTQLDLNCDSNVVINLPVICDTLAFGIGCIDGYAYCDDNNNGVRDSNETLLTNVPITLTVTNITSITVYTDANGYYSYSGWQLNTNNVFVSIDYNWQLMNGFISNGNGYLINSLDCNNANNTYDIGVNCTSPCADICTTVTPWVGYYQNY